MSKRSSNKAEKPKKVIRCAIYTRKSTEEGLEQEFNSLDAQRESGEACVAAQKHEGWVCLPEKYDDGGWSGGNIDRPALQRLLADIEAGRVTYHDEVHPGEHPAIVDKDVWEKVQAVLSRNGNTGGAVVRNKYGALLKGLIHCECCRCAMIPTYTAKGGAGGKKYQYYVCLQAQKRGWHACPSKSVPARQIEQFVVDQIKRIGNDPALLEGTLRQMRQQRAKELADLQAEQRGLDREVKRHHSALQKLSTTPDPARLADVTEALRRAEQRSTAVRTRVAVLEREHIEQGDVAAALTAFDPVWGELSPKEQARVMQLLIERVAYDGKQGTVAITFYPSGIKTLAAESNLEEAA